VQEVGADPADDQDDRGEDLPAELKPTLNRLPSTSSTRPTAKAIAPPRRKATSFRSTR